METVKEISEKLRNKKLDGVFGGLIEESTPLEVASEEEIRLSEKLFGITLPDSYKTFLKTFSNGNMYILGAEPLYGVGEHVDCANSAELLMSKEENRMSYIFAEDRYVPLEKLIPFTYGDMYELSIDHWAFMCDKEYPNHDYPVVYVSQNGHIVWRLKNFEEWLRIFWETNKDRESEFSSVFYTLCPDYKQRMELVDKEV